MDRLIWKIKGMRRTTLWLSIVSLLQAAGTIGQALFLAKAVSMLFYGARVSEALTPLLFFFVSLAIRYTAMWLSKRISGRFAEQTGDALQSELMEKIVELGPQHAAVSGSGKLVTLVVDGIVRFRTYLERYVPRLIDMVFVTLPILICAYILDPLSGLILTVTLPVLIIFFILLGSFAKKTAGRQWQSFQVLARHFTDTLRGLETLRYLGRSEAFADSVDNVSNRYRKATIRTLRVAFLSSFALDFFSTLSVAFVAVGLGLRLIEGGMELMPALAVLLLAPDYYQPVRMLGSDFHASADGKAAWTAIRKILDQPKPQDSLPKGSAAAASTSLDPLQAPIIFDEVSASGDEGELNRLSSLSFKLGGELRKIGIIGASGAGKTTLLNMLAGLLPPHEGMIRIDGAPLEGDVLAEWQRRTAYIPQHPYLFSSSLADNVRFYEPSASDEQVFEALHAAGLGDLLAELPRGIHEPIGDGGRSLSGGQAQRVALARALVGDRSVLLFDEPTAHLDLETEWELKMTMLPLFAGRRVFIATHRLHWMREMDWVLVLRDGKLVEQGTHEELMRRDGPYRALIEAASPGGGEER